MRFTSTCTFLVLLPAGCLDSSTAREGEVSSSPDAADAGSSSDAVGEPEDSGNGQRGYTPPDTGGEGPGPSGDPCAEAAVVDYLVEATEREAGSYTLLWESGETWALEGTCGGEGKEAVLRFVAPSGGMWRFDTEGELTGFDTLLHVRDTCADPETERACNDDVGWRQRGSRVDVQLAAGDTAFVVVDSYDASGYGDFQLSARAIPLADGGGACDPAEQEDHCEEGFFCYGAPGQAAGERGVCTPATAPQITDATAKRAPDRLFVSTSGRDDSLDVIGVRLELLLHGEALPLGRMGGTTVDLGFAEPQFGLVEVEGVVELPLGGFPAFEAVRVRLLDSQGLVSDPLDREVVGLPEVAAGETCDPAERDNVCAGETLCLVAAGSETGVCGSPAAPVLEAVEATLNAATNGLGLRLAGTDANGDVRAVRVILIDGDGEQIPYTVDGQSPAVGQDTALEGMLGSASSSGGAFTATFSKVLPASSVAGLVRVRVEVVDSQALHSGQVFAPVQPAPVVAPGEACDLGSGLSACPGDEVCHAADPAAGPTCGEPAVECPEGWGVVDLVGASRDGRFVVEGDTTGSEAATRGTCGGGSGFDVYRFVAPEAGTWHLRTEVFGRRADTVLYTRSHCRYEDPRLELGCNDDVSAEDGVIASALALALEQGQQVFVFVDGWAVPYPWQGEYSLTIERARD